MNSHDPEHVEVAVAVFRREGLLLVAYNSKWQAFTLPMTRRKHWADKTKAEPWELAAKRNVHEWFGPTVAVDLTLLADLEHVRQSDRDLRIRDYHFRIFGTQVAAATALREDVAAEWITPAEFSELYRRPISPTARLLVDELQKRGKLA